MRPCGATSRRVRGAKRPRFSLRTSLQPSPARSSTSTRASATSWPGSGRQARRRPGRLLLLQILPPDLDVGAAAQAVEVSLVLRSAEELPGAGLDLRALVLRLRLDD